jgi:hypothetical protein
LITQLEMIAFPEPSASGIRSRTPFSSRIVSKPEAFTVRPPREHLVGHVKP